MKQNAKEFYIQLLKDCTSKKGILDLLSNVEAFNSNNQDGLIETVSVPVTLRRMELLVFIESKLVSAVENEKFIEAQNFLMVKQFYLSRELQVLKCGSSISLILPAFFNVSLIFLLSLLNEFDIADIIDKENDYLLNYDEKGLIEFLLVLALLKKDEILWGWNNDQLTKTDWRLSLEKGEVLKLECTTLSEGISYLNLILRKNKSMNNSPIFVIVEGMAYHEEEIKTFIEELKNNLPDCLFKMTMKEVAEPEPIVNFVYVKK